jgi:hypothetical protein
MEVFVSDHAAVRRLARTMVVGLALSTTTSLLAACSTPSATRDLEYALGCCALGTGVVGGTLVATSVVYDPRARQDDGAFIPVADQEGVSLLPWGIGIGVVGVAAGGTLIAIAALTEIPEDKVAVTTPTQRTVPTSTDVSEPLADVLDADATVIGSPDAVVAP